MRLPVNGSTFMQYRVPGSPAGAVPVAARAIGFESGCAASGAGDAATIRPKARISSLRAMFVSPTVGRPTTAISLALEGPNKLAVGDRVPLRGVLDIRHLGVRG